MLRRRAAEADEDILGTGDKGMRDVVAADAKYIFTYAYFWLGFLE